MVMSAMVMLAEVQEWSAMAAVDSTAAQVSMVEAFIEVAASTRTALAAASTAEVTRTEAAGTGEATVAVTGADS